MRVRKMARFCAFFRVLALFCAFLCFLFLPKWPAEKRKVVHNRTKICKKRFYAIPPFVIPPFACHRVKSCKCNCKGVIGNCRIFESEHPTICHWNQIIALHPESCITPEIIPKHLEGVSGSVMFELITSKTMEKGRVMI